MVDWTRYESIIKTTGETQRERELYKAKQFILRNGRANPSFKKVHINDDSEERWLAINSGTQTYYKKIHTLPNEVIYPGDMVTWSNSKWLVITADSDQEFIVDGTMQQCNRVLKWQNENGDIIDFLGGRDDLERKLIHSVGDADERFEQDALRILRAIRFAAVLDFQLDS